MATKIFFAMPFSGRKFGDLVAARTQIAEQCSSCGLTLLEQLIGREEESLFEGHNYDASFIALKDFSLIAEADLVIADFSGPSIGRDCEVVAACEVFRKPVIAVVPDPEQRRHPWIRLYSRWIVETSDHAFSLAATLGRLWTHSSKKVVDQEIIATFRRSEKESVSLVPTELVARWRRLLGNEWNQSVISVGPHSSLRMALQTMLNQNFGGSSTKRLVIRTINDLRLLDQRRFRSARNVFLLPQTVNEGLMPLAPHRFLEWQLHKVVHSGQNARDLLLRTYDRIRPSQRLVYATCSLAPEENELAVDALLRAHPDASLSLSSGSSRSTSASVLRSWGHLSMSSELSLAIRINPTPDAPFGYFMAVIAKDSESVLRPS